MNNVYANVTTRFLRKEEKLISSHENEMPLVIEAKNETDTAFLRDFLTTHSEQILNDIATYGAVLLRGFDIASEEDFESTVLSIRGMRGISEAFMSEQGRVPVRNLKYILHTNAVYKTGGTLYLGGFHSENYYSPDVPAYISFCCLKPATLGGETGLINMEKVYSHFTEDLKAKLEKHTFFVSKWLLSEVAKRYQLPVSEIEKWCHQFNLPIITMNNEKFIVMHKPSVFENPITGKKSLQINYFELNTLNSVLRKQFIKDYTGKEWLWHRLVWRLPDAILKIPEYMYIIFASLFYSPKESFNILLSKFNTYKAFNSKKQSLPFNNVKVKNCFNKSEVADLAKLMRQYYVSCIWKKGDVLLVDNRKVLHAGMPGSGSRVIRAMICNPLDMQYSFIQSGTLACKNRLSETLGFYISPEPAVE